MKQRGQYVTLSFNILGHASFHEEKTFIMLAFIKKNGKLRFLKIIFKLKKKFQIELLPHVTLNDL